jgi:hypothetical protein
MKRSAWVWVAAVTAGVFGTGCAVEAKEADRFREAIPEAEAVSLAVPGPKGGATGTTTQGLHFSNLGGDGTARYYRFTRDLTRSVDVGTAFILGAVWAIVHTDPTTIEPKRAVWGPGQANALEPAVWRFTVTEVGDATYDYVLEGQPKAGGAWSTVLRGHGFGKSKPEHKSGWFEIDNEAMRTLDPAEGKDRGTAKVTFDLTKLPATIAVELRPIDGAGFTDVTVTHAEGGAGAVDITALADIDDSKATKLEDVRVESRWTPAGSGRADIELSKGDLPFVVTATECWSETFARVYYEDTVDFEPSSGDASACALPR